MQNYFTNQTTNAITTGNDVVIDYGRVDFNNIVDISNDNIYDNNTNVYVNIDHVQIDHVNIAHVNIGHANIDRVNDDYNHFNNDYFDIDNKNHGHLDDVVNLRTNDVNLVNVDNVNNKSNYDKLKIKCHFILRRNLVFAITGHR